MKIDKIIEAAQLVKELCGIREQIATMKRFSRGTSISITVPAMEPSTIKVPPSVIKDSVLAYLEKQEKELTTKIEAI